MPTRIAGFILRADDKHRTAQFYAKLGLNLDEHEHGGPRHYFVGPVSSDYVVEIYQKSAAFSGDALMLEVDSIDEALQAIADLGTEPKSDIKDGTSMRFVYITDPDGRDVMLIEKK